MNQEDYLQPLIHCTLCEHRCGVNRLEGQTGICRMTLPAVASATLHPAPPESYTIFMAGCNYKYIGCFAKDKLWEYRVLVIPKINEEEIEPLCCFISDIDADLPVRFLAFRPNYLNAMFRKFRHRIFRPWWSKSSKCQKSSCFAR